MDHLKPVPAAVPSSEGTRGGHAERRQTARVAAAAVQRGDEAAFAELYDATSARVYGLVLRVVRDPAQAEEVAQEAFLEIWRTAAGSTRPGAARSAGS